MTDRETLDHIAEEYTASDDTKQTELLPCPFCGKGTVYIEPDYDHSKAVMLRHHSDGCIIDNLCDWHLDIQQAIAAWNTRASIGLSAAAALHSDDKTVHKFAAEMKQKLSVARQKGRGGWDDPEVCTTQYLAELLIGHLSKGNEGTFLDIANFAMMLHMRGADPAELATLLEQRDKAVEAAALEKALTALDDERKAYIEKYNPDALNVFLTQMISDAEIIRNLIDPDAPSILAERERAAKVRALKRASHIFVWANDKKSAVEKIEALIKATEENE